jgi:hypothetical protein
MATLILASRTISLSPGRIEAMGFASRREAEDWCRSHHPRVPAVEIGRDDSKRVVMGSMGRPRKVE